MTITLDLPPDVEGVLTQEAQRQGTTPESLILEDLRRLYPAGMDEDQRRRHDILGEIIARAQTMTPRPTASEKDDPVGDAIVDKYRRQGFHL